MTTGTDTTKVYLKYTSNLIYSEFESFAIDTAKGAGKILMKYFGKLSNHSSKSSYRDLVTKADLESEDYIIKMIQPYYYYANTHQIGDKWDKWSIPKFS